MQAVVNLLLHYSYLVLFLGVVLEGEIFPLAAGFLVSLGVMDFGSAVLVTFVGAFGGDVLWFFAGRYFGRPLVNAANRWFGLAGRRLLRLEQHFAEKGERTLWLTKFIYSFGHSSIIVAGVAGMRLRAFVRVDLPASLVWAVVFITLGYFFGSSFSLLQHLLRDVVWAAIVVGLAVVLTEVTLRRRLVREV